ncbi:hypothetical protein GCM10023175_00700 [Pseudonocardia xishanensis]|uniref:Uncharacterized protein n=1 Tax=Pseudonocardia xishanensis TaxID=630995 RepID=A0ABP8RCT5_9PSEU
MIEINKKAGYRLISKPGEKGLINLSNWSPSSEAPWVRPWTPSAAAAVTDTGGVVPEALLAPQQTVLAQRCRSSGRVAKPGGDRGRRERFRQGS